MADFFPFGSKITVNEDVSVVSGEVGAPNYTRENGWKFLHSAL